MHRNVFRRKDSEKPNRDVLVGVVCQNLSLTALKRNNQKQRGK